MTEMLFDTPWWILLCLVVGAVGLFIYANARTDNTLRKISLVLLAVPVVLAGLSWLVATDLEKAYAKTHAFVRAVEARDPRAVRDLLYPTASIGVWDADDIAYGSKLYADRFGLKSTMVHQMQHEQTDEMITIRFSVLSQHDSSAELPVGSLNSSWEFSWVRDGDDWLLQAIKPLKVAQSETAEVNTRYFSKPVAPANP